MSIEDWKTTLTDKDVTLICNAARKAWDRASPKARKVTFSWRGKQFKSTMTDMRMVVDTMRTASRSRSGGTNSRLDDILAEERIVLRNPPMSRADALLLKDFKRRRGVFRLPC